MDIAQNAAVMQKMAANDPHSNLPTILLCGLPRSGKSSIAKVVFQKMPPHETLFLEPTSRPDIKPIAHNSLLQFKLCDFGGGQFMQDDNITQQDSYYFSKATAVIFVIDAQDEPYNDALDYAKRLITKIYAVSPSTYFEIFIHKVDGDLFLSDEHKTDCQTDIHTKLTEDLYNTNANMNLYLTFHCTSIYDHSVFEAMSKVVQKLIPELPVLEQLLDLLVTNCRIEKGFLFDVVSKIYIASDSQPVDIASYELCSDMIDVVIDVSCIYGMEPDDDAYSIAYDAHSSCVIQLNNGMLLYLKQVEHFLAFACLIREENFDRQYLLDYNIDVFKDSLLQLFNQSPLSQNMITQQPAAAVEGDAVAGGGSSPAGVGGD